MEDTEIGWRVKSPHYVPTEELPKNGNSAASKKGDKLVVSSIGTGLSEKEAREIAEGLNRQKGLLDRIIHPAKAVKDKV